eukprot:gene12727-2330_t
MHHPIQCHPFAGLDEVVWSGGSPSHPACAPGCPLTCAECGQAITDICTTTPGGVHFHAACLACSVCGQPVLPFQDWAEQQALADSSHGGRPSPVHTRCLSAPQDEQTAYQGAALHEAVFNCWNAAVQAEAAAASARACGDASALAQQARFPYFFHPATTPPAWARLCCHDCAKQPALHFGMSTRAFLAQQSSDPTQAPCQQAYCHTPQAFETQASGAFSAQQQAPAQPEKKETQTHRPHSGCGWNGHACADPPPVQALVPTDGTRTDAPVATHLGPLERFPVGHLEPPGTPPSPSLPGAETGLPAISPEDVLVQVNVLRGDPPGYSRFLEDLVPLFEGKVRRRPGAASLVTKEGLPAVQEAISALRATPPLACLRLSRGLCRSARAHCADTGPSGTVGHAGSDGSRPADRMAQVGQWFGRCAEAIAYGNHACAMHFVLELLVDDGVADRGHRQTLLDPDFRFFGAAVGPHQAHRLMCVQEFAVDYYEDVHSVSRAPQQSPASPSATQPWQQPWMPQDGSRLATASIPATTSPTPDTVGADAPNEPANEPAEPPLEALRSTYLDRAHTLYRPPHSPPDLMDLICKPSLTQTNRDYNRYVGSTIPASVLAHAKGQRHQTLPGPSSLSAPFVPTHLRSPPEAPASSATSSCSYYGLPPQGYPPLPLGGWAPEHANQLPDIKRTGRVTSSGQGMLSQRAGPPPDAFWSEMVSQGKIFGQNTAAGAQTWLGKYQ